MNDLHTEMTLDVRAARAVGGASFITTSGAYVGTITAARIYKSKSGAEMLDIDFESNEGERAHIQMCIYDKEKNPTFQRAIVDSLMTVCRVRSLKAEQRRFKDRQGQEQTGYFFVDLMNKPIGLLIQAGPEEYDVKGEVKTMIRLNLLTPFDAHSRQNAAEILDQGEARAVDARLKNLKDKPLKKIAPRASNGFESAPAPRGGYEAAPATIPQAAPSGDFSPDDIPF